MSTDMLSNSAEEGEIVNSCQVDNECGICRDEMILPYTLGCGHKFCFLCLKGAVQSSSSSSARTLSSNCPQCRAPFVLKSVTLTSSSSNSGSPLGHSPTHTPLNQSGETVGNSSSSSADKSQAVWLYAGGSGYWQYDPRTNSDMEMAYQEYVEDGEKKEKEMWILHRKYFINFETMEQCFQDSYGRNKKRGIKRVDLKTEYLPFDVKGVAGLKFSS